MKWLGALVTSMEGKKQTFYEELNGYMFKEKAKANQGISGVTRGKA